MNLDRTLSRKQGRVTASEREILHFAEAHFERLRKSNARWNGRQIRNAFQTALAMAEYEAFEAVGLEGAWEESAALENIKSKLKVAHFETVAEASSQFDRYIEETIGGTDAERAFTDRERSDHFKWMVPTNAQSYQNAQATHNPYTQTRSDPFASSRVRQEEEHYHVKTLQSLQSQPWLSSKPGWAGDGPTLAQPSQTPDILHSYFPHGLDPQAQKHMSANSEHGFSAQQHTHNEGLQRAVSSTTPSFDRKSATRTPVTLGAATHCQDEDGY